MMNSLKHYKVLRLNSKPKTLQWVHTQWKVTLLILYIVQKFKWKNKVRLQHCPNTSDTQFVGISSKDSSYWEYSFGISSYGQSNLDDLPHDHETSSEWKFEGHLYSALSLLLAADLQGKLSLEFNTVCQASWNKLGVQYSDSLLGTLKRILFPFYNPRHKALTGPQLTSSESWILHRNSDG